MRHAAQRRKRNESSPSNSRSQLKILTTRVRCDDDALLAQWLYLLTDFCSTSGQNTSLSAINIGTEEDVPSRRPNPRRCRCLRDVLHPNTHLRHLNKLPVWQLASQRELPGSK